MPRERESEKVRPVHEVRLGRIRAAIWENRTENGPRHNVTLSRLYKDEQDDWRDSDSFGRDDLLVLAKVADLAHTWICDQSAQQSRSANGQSPDRAPAETRQEDVHF